MCEPMFIPISAIRAPSFHPQNTGDSAYPMVLYVAIPHTSK